MRNESDEISGFSIQPRGVNGTYIVIMEYRDFREPQSFALDEDSLLTRIQNLENAGYDASVSRVALTALRLKKQEKDNAEELGTEIGFGTR
jgi:hypothetical protein